MKKEKLAERLMELPLEISNIQLELLTLSEDSQKAANETLTCETRLRVLISGLTDDQGKKLHSNEDSRRAAFAEMTADDEELNDLKLKNKGLEHELQLKKIKYEALTNEQRNIRTILAFLSGNASQD